MTFNVNRHYIYSFQIRNPLWDAIIMFFEGCLGVYQAVRLVAILYQTRWAHCVEPLSPLLINEV